MKRIITIQHCQSEQHINGMMGGWNDWELTELGHAQARGAKIYAALGSGWGRSLRGSP